MTALTTQTRKTVIDVSEIKYHLKYITDFSKAFTRTYLLLIKSILTDSIRFLFII